MPLIRVPYTFTTGRTEVDFQDYNTVMHRVNAFSNVTNIGKDSSNIYDMKMITMGKSGKPKILVMSAMHPPEWAGLQYALEFFEMLRDDTFPDSVFRAKLLSNFELLYIPVVNPWGLANLDDPLAHYSQYRYTVNGIDLNDDFYSFTQKESQNVKAIMDTHKPVAFLDIHMYVADYAAAGGKNMVLGNGQDGTDLARKTFAQSWGMSAGQDVHEWDGGLMSAQSEVARKYASIIQTPYAEYPLAYITEMVRPSHNFPNTPLSFTQIMEYGVSSLYLFFKMTMDYFHKRKQ